MTDRPVGAEAASGVAKAPSDLRTRVLSAIVMLIIAGGALWLDGVWLDAFIGFIAIAVFAEYVQLAGRIAPDPVRMGAAAISGACYVGWAAIALIVMNGQKFECELEDMLNVYEIPQAARDAVPPDADSVMVCGRSIVVLPDPHVLGVHGPFAVVDCCRHTRSMSITRRTNRF